MKRLVFLFALVACSKSKPAATPAPAKVITTQVQSAALGVAKDVVVYLPADYETSGKRYPVFYYLHGLGCDERYWVDRGKLDQTANALGLDAIVVMPDGDDGFYADSTKAVDYEACMKDGTGLFMPMRDREETCVRASRYETYVTKDLVPWVDATYRTIPKREARGIAGFSMGGFGALVLAMRHPDMFTAAASHSGVDALLYAGPAPYEKGKAKLFTQADLARPIEDLGVIERWIVGIFGSELATWKSYDPAALAGTLDRTGPALYLDCGTEDEFQLHNGMQYLHDVLLERGIEHAYYIGPGGHDFGFWAVRVKNSLEFLRSKTAKPSTSS